MLKWPGRGAVEQLDEADERRALLEGARTDGNTAVRPSSSSRRSQLIQVLGGQKWEARGARVSEFAGEAPVLLYDGSCGFCSSTVQLVLRHDRVGTLRFAALQSPFAARVLARRPELRGVDSAVWVDPAKGQVLTRSAAGLRIAGYLGGLWRLALLLWIVPRPIRDWGYDLIARHRHLLMGGAAHCLVPPPNVRHRFLDGGERHDGHFEWASRPTTG